MSGRLPPELSTAAYERMFAVVTSYVTAELTDETIDQGRRLIGEALRDGSLAQMAEFLALELVGAYGAIGTLTDQEPADLWRRNCVADAADPRRPWETGDDGPQD